MNLKTWGHHVAYEHVKKRESVDIPLENAAKVGTFHTFDGFPPTEEHFAIGFDGTEDGAAPLVRIHSECVTGDVFGSQRCDCGHQLMEAVRVLSEAGGYILYMRQEGRGIGLVAKIDAYRQQDLGYDTFAANKVLGYPEDARSFAPAAAILRALGVERIRLLTNNPEKVRQIRQYGITVEEVVPTGVYLGLNNRRYLEAKRLQHGHQIDL